MPSILLLFDFDFDFGLGALHIIIIIFIFIFFYFFNFFLVFEKFYSILRSRHICVICVIGRAILPKSPKKRVFGLFCRFLCRNT